MLLHHPLGKVVARLVQPVGGAGLQATTAPSINASALVTIAPNDGIAELNRMTGSTRYGSEAGIHRNLVKGLFRPEAAMGFVGACLGSRLHAPSLCR